MVICGTLVAVPFDVYAVWAVSLSCLVAARSYAFLTALAVAASVVDVELMLSLSCTMPVCDVVAERMVFLVAVTLPLASWDNVSIAVMVVPSAVGSLLAREPAVRTPFVVVYTALPEVEPIAPAFVMLPWACERVLFRRSHEMVVVFCVTMATYGLVSSFTQHVNKYL